VLDDIAISRDRFPFSKMEPTNFDEVHVGMPPGPLSNWVVKKVHVHGFAGLTAQYVESPEFSFFGHQWTVLISPNGNDKSTEGYVSFYLVNKSPESIQAEFQIILRSTARGSFQPTTVGEVDTKWPFGMCTFGAQGGMLCSGAFAKRGTILTFLNNGTLTLEIHLRTYKKAEPTIFVPSNPFCDNVLKVFNNEEKSDVVFIVGGEVESAANRRKRAKTAATRFYASHVILDVNAPSLADMCRPGDEAAVPINGVEPEVFKMVLYFCYGGAITVEELAAKAKEIIEAADRFGIVNLKLQAEAVLTEQTEITVDNMLDNLLYANSKNLALFQEKIMDFVAENGGKILGNVSFSSVPSELMSDLLTAVTRGQKSSSTSEPGDDLKLMRVSELRKQLHDKGLCIDGSRDAMIALLGENSASDETGALET